MNVSPIYAGLYRMKLSLWGFQWNAGKPEPDQIEPPCCEPMRKANSRKAVACCEHFTAPSMKSNEAEITEWLDAHGIVFDPVSIPWNGLRIGQIAGRAKESMSEPAWRLTGSRSKARSMFRGHRKVISACLAIS